MDGRNSTGRKVSLLNNDHSAVPLLQRLPSFGVAHFSLAHSRSPSCASSTPSLSPQTPHLVRSESSESESRGLPPSPQTPHFSAFNPVHHHQIASLYSLTSSSYSKMDDQGASMYPPIPEASGMLPYPMPAATSQTPVYRASTSPISEVAHMSNASNATSSSANKPTSTTKKNQYPCPLAKQIGCTDFFTTSGHAARHAKKHTGKKDAFCPECNKAFTRKDNMEQHRRTHQSVRGPVKTGGDNRVKKSTKPPTRKSDKPGSAPLEAAVAQLEQHQLSQQSMMVPGPYFLNADPVQALPHPPTDFATRPPMYRASYPSSLDFVPPTASMVSDSNEIHFNYPSPGLSNGLDTLALAASDHRRMSEEDSS